MLFMLTGDIQIGKTRWLQQLVAALESRNVKVWGVIAPGDWAEKADVDGTVAYEKLGIFNELLPSHERIQFARRIDLASDAIAEGACSQAAEAKLAWAIEDDAIVAVNEHLAGVANATATRTASKCGGKEEPGTGESGADTTPLKPGNAHSASDNERATGQEFGQNASSSSILIIDELGRLELLKGTGLVEAMTLLDRGAVPALPHALVVVRETLLDCALERFAHAEWGTVLVISPDTEAKQTVLEACVTPQ